MNENLRDRPVFVCGHPKSGTSLLVNLLDGHPELVVFPEEAMFFRRVLPKMQGLTPEEKITLAEQTLIHFFEWNIKNPPPSQIGNPESDYSEISYDQIREVFHSILRDFVPRHDGDLLSAAVMAFGQVSGQLTEKTHRWVEKTPYNEMYIDEILSFWPDAKLIHIIRDPRDNYVSYVKKHPEWSAPFFAANWNRFSRIGLENGSRYGETKYALIRYEHLVLETDNALIKIRKLLGIKDNIALMTPTKNRKDWAGNSMFPEKFDRISSNPIGRWRNAKNPGEISSIEIISRATMASLDYSLEQKQTISDYLRVARWYLWRWSLAILKRISPKNQIIK